MSSCVKEEVFDVQEDEITRSAATNTEIKTTHAAVLVTLGKDKKNKDIPYKTDDYIKTRHIIFSTQRAIANGSDPNSTPRAGIRVSILNGKSTVFALTGSDNPAKTYGYDVAGLQSLNTAFADALLGKDQWGNARPDNVMGAYTGE